MHVSFCLHSWARFLRKINSFLCLFCLYKKLSVPPFIGWLAMHSRLVMVTSSLAGQALLCREFHRASFRFGFIKLFSPTLLPLSWGICIPFRNLIVHDLNSSGLVNFLCVVVQQLKESTCLHSSFTPFYWPDSFIRLPVAGSGIHPDGSKSEVLSISAAAVAFTCSVAFALW